MYNRFSILIIITLALALLVLWGACVRQVAPALEQKTMVPLLSPPDSRAPWEQEWKQTLAEAKKEGKVNVYTLWAPEARGALGKAFRERFGITLDFTSFGRGADLLARVHAEKRAGLYLADAFGAGATTLIAVMKPAEVLGPLEPLLIFPEVINPKFWRGEKIPFQDRDKMAIGLVAYYQRYIFYNTDLIREGEVTTYKDALKPQFKGRVTLNDPTVSGVGNAFISHLANHIWSTEEAMEFLRQLIKQQEVVIQRDNRLHIESVARGKFALGLAPHSTIEQFIDIGTPIKLIIAKEGTFVSSGTGALGVPTAFGNPKAAKVFVNWILSKEGQTVYYKNAGFPSLRADVSMEGIHSVFLPQPGEKLHLDSEEHIIFRGKMLEIASKTIEEAMKK